MTPDQRLREMRTSKLPLSHERTRTNSSIEPSERVTGRTRGEARGLEHH